MNAAHQPVVQWLPELAPSLEAREAARTLFEQQTGTPPVKLYDDRQLGVWGWIGHHATLLFKIPEASS